MTPEPRRNPVEADEVAELLFAMRDARVPAESLQVPSHHATDTAVTVGDAVCSDRDVPDRYITFP